MSAPTPPPPLSLSFTLTSTHRSRTRVYALQLTDGGRPLCPATESLPSEPCPARFATTALLPSEAALPVLQLLVGGQPRASAALALREAAAAAAAPLRVRLLDGSVSVLVYARPHRPELATHRLSVRVASRGVVNAFSAGFAPDCEVVVSRRRRDGSWQALYRSLRGNEAGGGVLLRCSDDGSDVAVKVEAMAVRGSRRVACGECRCSLQWLRERRVGERLPLSRDGTRRGYAVVARVEGGKAESRFVFEVYVYGGCGPDSGDLAMVMANDAEQSVPGAAEEEEVGKDGEGRQGSECWVGAFWRAVRMRADCGRVQRGAFESGRDVEHSGDGEALAAPRESRF